MAAAGLISSPHRTDTASANPDTDADADAGDGDKGDKPDKPCPGDDAAEDADGGGDAPSDDADSDDASADAGNLEESEAEVLDLLNKTREQAGLDPVTLNSELAEGSRAWSCTMAKSGTFEHDPGNFAENIGYADAAAVHDDWMTSTGHRNNRMNPDHTEYGIGLCVDDDGTLYWTERFR